MCRKGRRFWSNGVTAQAINLTAGLEHVQVSQLECVLPGEHNVSEGGGYEYPTDPFLKASIWRNSARLFKSLCCEIQQLFHLFDDFRRLCDYVFCYRFQLFSANRTCLPASFL